jgi:hypothetical protein
VRQTAPSSRCAAGTGSGDSAACAPCAVLVREQHTTVMAQLVVRCSMQPLLLLLHGDTRMVRGHFHASVSLNTTSSTTPLTRSLRQPVHPELAEHSHSGGCCHRVRRSPHAAAASQPFDHLAAPQGPAQGHQGQRAQLRPQSNQGARCHPQCQHPLQGCVPPFCSPPPCLQLTIASVRYPPPSQVTSTTTCSPACLDCCNYNPPLKTPCHHQAPSSRLQIVAGI